MKTIRVAALAEAKLAQCSRSISRSGNQSASITRWAWQTAHCNGKPRTDKCILSGSLQTEHVCSANIYLIPFVPVHTRALEPPMAQSLRRRGHPKVYHVFCLAECLMAKHFIYLRSISHRNKFDFTMDTHWCDESFRSTNNRRSSTSFIWSQIRLYHEQ